MLCLEAWTRPQRETRPVAGKPGLDSTAAGDFADEGVELEGDAFSTLSRVANGDLRKAITLLQSAVLPQPSLLPWPLPSLRASSIPVSCS